MSTFVKRKTSTLEHSFTRGLWQTELSRWYVRAVADSIDGAGETQEAHYSLHMQWELSFWWMSLYAGAVVDAVTEWGEGRLALAGLMRAQACAPSSHPSYWFLLSPLAPSFYSWVFVCCLMLMYNPRYYYFLYALPIFHHVPPVCFNKLLLLLRVTCAH